MWLDCHSARSIGEALDVEHKTVTTWCGESAQNCGNSPPESRQHFDVWQFATADKGDGQQSYFGALVPEPGLMGVAGSPGRPHGRTPPV